MNLEFPALKEGRIIPSPLILGTKNSSIEEEIVAYREDCGEGSMVTVNGQIFVTCFKSRLEILCRAGLSRDVMPSIQLPHV